MFKIPMSADASELETSHATTPSQGPDACQRRKARVYERGGTRSIARSRGHQDCSDLAGQVTGRFLESSLNVRFPCSIFHSAIGPPGQHDVPSTNDATYFSALCFSAALTSGAHAFPTTIRKHRELWICWCRGQCFQPREKGSKGPCRCYKWWVITEDLGCFTSQADLKSRSLAQAVNLVRSRRRGLMEQEQAEEG